MISTIRETFIRLINNTQTRTFRYLYHRFRAEGRLTGLVGPRGVGKTTLLLQYIKTKVTAPEQAFYFSADHFFFNTASLFEFVRDLHEEEDIRLFFIDEIHKYRNWNQELKNIHDSFPRIKVVFSGSSSLDLVHGAYDLSRRGVIHRLHGMSFREYLNLAAGHDLAPVTLDDIISGRRQIAAELAEIPRLKAHFRAFLKQGYYPFALEEGHFPERLEAVINKTIHDDIANFYNLKTANLRYFKRILAWLATSPPGPASTGNLAANLGIDHKTAAHYLEILQDTGLVRLLGADQRGNRLLRAPEKILLENPNLTTVIAAALGREPDKGAIRETFLAAMLAAGGHTVFARRKHGDFTVDGTVFEVGGRSKGRAQTKAVKGPAFVVKDDILVGGRGEIPLHLFGFLY